MEIRANFLLIAGFVLVTLVAAFRFSFFILNPDWISDDIVYEMTFSSPAVGLSLGTPVYFNGLKIGKVIEIPIPADAASVVALAKLDKLTPIGSDTKAKLKQSELMGSAFISLEGASASAPRLTALPGQRYPRLLVEDARQNYPDFRELLAHSSTTFEKLKTALNGVQSSLSVIKWYLDNADEALKPVLLKPGDRPQPTMVSVEALTSATDRLDRMTRVAEQFAKSRQLENLADVSVTLNKMSSRDLQKLGRLAVELREKINRFDEKIRELGLQPLSPAAVDIPLPNHK